ncbi:MAG TPA: 4-aminobutyrate--2-oxoglutarate transaminase, partial [Acidobacteria bacterium]|nr:4-aminobutyrate--2-oxoglutarate transaminase [Acidobacteriota bacterium]
TYEVFVDRADNAEVWDVQGQRYIDFAGGIAVMNVGHGHPKVVAAIEAQLKRFTHTCYQVVPYESYIGLAEKLNALTPGSHAKKTALFSTGAEAVENAIKIARSYTKRSGVIAFGGAFHGRSLFAVSLTGKVMPYKAGFGPFPPEIYHAPFPCHCASLAEVKKAVHGIFKADIEPSRVAAIIFEPVQGEGGFNVIQAEAVQWLRALCDEHGIVLIADEIQTGFGRTGKLFAYEHEAIRPDVVIVGKALSGGFYPVSGILADDEVMGVFHPGEHGSTYGGNPMAAAVARAALAVLVEEGMVGRSAELGPYFMDRLRAISSPHVKEVRGKGLWIGIELHREAGGARRFCEALQKLGLLCKETHDHVIRIAPPLTITKGEIDWAVERLEQVLTGP